MSDSSSLRYGILDSGSDALRTNTPLKIFSKKCSPKQNAPCQNTLHQSAHRKKMLSSPTLVNGFETNLTYLNLT